MKSRAVRFTEAELWFLVNAIPQAGFDADPAGQSANEKIYAAWAANHGTEQPK